jgi:hypothetical protein
LETGLTYTAGLSLGEAFRFAWSTYKRHAGLFIAILLAMAGAWVVVEVLVVAGQDFGLWW